MNLALLIVGALVLPGLWGSLVAVLFERFIPTAKREKPAPILSGSDPYPMNFQI